MIVPCAGFVATDDGATSEPSVAVTVRVVGSSGRESGRREEGRLNRRVAVGRAGGASSTVRPGVEQSATIDPRDLLIIVEPGRGDGGVEHHLPSSRIAYWCSPGLKGTDVASQPGSPDALIGSPGRAQPFQSPTTSTSAVALAGWCQTTMLHERAGGGDGTESRCTRGRAPESRAPNSAVVAPPHPLDLPARVRLSQIPTRPGVVAVSAADGSAPPAVHSAPIDRPRHPEEEQKDRDDDDLEPLQRRAATSRCPTPSRQSAARSRGGSHAERAEHVDDERRRVEAHLVRDVRERFAVAGRQARVNHREPEMRAQEQEDTDAREALEEVLEVRVGAVASVVRLAT